MSRSWVLIDVDKIDQKLYDWLSQNSDAFIRPGDGAFAVPVDAELSSHAILQLAKDGVPMDAMRITR